MKTTLSFERIIGEFKEIMEDRSFMQGDYYNIYHHVVMDKELGSDQKMINRFAGFQVTEINAKNITIEKIAPPIATQKLEIDQKAEFDFGQYGTYTITLKSIAE